MRAGVWLSGVAAALAFVVGSVAAIDGLAWLLVPAAASLATVFAWLSRRSAGWGVVAAVAHWTPLAVLAVTAWDWVWLGAPLVPAALIQTAAVVLYLRSHPAKAGPAHA